MEQVEQLAIVHYDEVALKGNNRAFFERALIDSIRNKLGDAFTVENARGRIFVRGDNTARIADVLRSTPGVAAFGLGVTLPRTEANTISIGEAAVSVAEGEEFSTFRVSARRADKEYPQTSDEIDREVGGVVYEHFKRKKAVSLHKPDLEIVIEILYKQVVVYKKESGIGGLPIGSATRAVALLSGGFDSPVATYQLIKRGVRPVCVHFHGLPKTSPEAIEKVRELTKVLSRYAGKIELVLVPSVPIMQAIAKSAPPKLRVVLLRRAMMRVSERIARMYKAKAIVTGESVGQVASQTLENLGAIGSATELPVLRPLCGSNKVEIINMARAIGTHDISVRPHDDTCSMFVPERPETKAKMHEVLEAEQLYNTETLIDEALGELESEQIV